MERLDSSFLDQYSNEIAIEWGGAERVKRYAFGVGLYKQMLDNGRSTEVLRTKIAGDLASVIGYENSDDRVENRILPMTFVPKFVEGEGYKLVTKGYDEEQDLLPQCAIESKQDFEETWVAKKFWERTRDDFRLGREVGFGADEFRQRPQDVYVWMSGPDDEGVGCVREQRFNEGRVQIGFQRETDDGIELQTFNLPTVWSREEFERVGNVLWQESREGKEHQIALNVDELRKKALFIPRESGVDVLGQIEQLAPEFDSYFAKIRSGETQMHYEQVLDRASRVVEKTIMPRILGSESREDFRRIGAAAEEMMIEDYGYSVQSSSNCGELNSDGAWLDGRGGLFGEEEESLWMPVWQKPREFWSDGKRYVFVKKCGFHRDNGGNCRQVFEKFVEVGSKCPGCRNTFVCG